MPPTCQPAPHIEAASGTFMAALMHAAQHGERAAYTALLHSIAHHAHQHALSRGAAAAQASTYVQNVLATVHYAMPTYDPRRPFWPWLDAILRARAATLPTARRPVPRALGITRRTLARATARLSATS